jgi:hypothetical protein
MDSNLVHLVGYVGDEKDRAVTITIRRGASRTDVMFLVTKMLEAIHQGEAAFNAIHRYNEFRISSPSYAPVQRLVAE